MERVLLVMPQEVTRLECWRKLGLLATAGGEVRLFWRGRLYNEVRPHSAIGNKPPIATHNSGDATSPSSSSEPENSNLRRSELASQGRCNLGIEHLRRPKNYRFQGSP